MTDAGGRLPTFFIIGAQKAGTTSLHHYLRGHPQLFLSDPKEPNFFTAPITSDRLARYRALFAAAADATAVGEASTTYSMHPHYDGVGERLVSVVPEPRLIYLVREPISRMRSAYQHALAWGSETRPIDVALTSDARYVDPSRYAFQLQQWSQLVPPERILVLTLDDLQRDRDETMGRVLRFLGVDDGWRPDEINIAFNDSAPKRAPRAAWRRVGDVVIRRGAGARVPGPVVRLNDRRSRLLTRAIRSDELQVSESVRRVLLEGLRADLGQLAGWLDDRTPAWAKEFTFD